MTHKSLLFAVWLAMMIDIAAYLVMVNFLFWYLRKHHQLVWINLGRPSFIWNNTPQIAAMFVSWLVHRDYRLLGDKTALRAGTATLILFWGGVVLFALTISLEIVTQGGNT